MMNSKTQALSIVAGVYSLVNVGIWTFLGVYVLAGLFVLASLFSFLSYWRVRKC